MGQILSSTEMRKVVDSNLKSYLAQSSSTYSKLFNKSPTFITYYAQNIAESYTDVNLGGAIQIIGPDSPLEFSVVNDFPAYGISDIDVSAAYDELKGVVTDNVRGELFLLPGTLTPTENDFFSIDYLDTKILFRVISSNADRLEGNAYFKLTYALDPSALEDINKQVSGKFTFELANVGTEFSPLIQADTTLVLREMNAIVDSLKESYWKAFYDRSTGVLMLQDGEVPTYNRCVNYAIATNDLLSSAGYLKSRRISLPEENSDVGFFEDCIYPQSIYYVAEKKIGLDSVSRRIRLGLSRPTIPSSPFFANYVLTGYNIALPDGIASTYFPSKEFWDLVDDSNATVSNPIISIGVRCLKSDGFSSDVTEAIREFNTLINDRTILVNRGLLFSILPLILMQAKQFHAKARQNI